MSDLYANDKIREAAERLVHNEVVCCVSSLIWELRGAVYECSSLGQYEDDINTLSEIVDWEEPAEQYIDEMDREDLIKYLDYQGCMDTDEDVPVEELRAKARKAADEQGFENFCNDHDVEPDRSEVYEHWVVSNWLAGKLEAQGHPVVHDFMGLTIWGRPTTGQAISIDYTILKIAQEMVGE